MASSHGIKVVHVFHTKVNEFDKKGTDVKRFTSGHLLMKEGVYSSWNRKRLTDKEKGGQKERAELFGEAIIQLSNQLYQTVTGGPIVRQPDGQTLKM